MHLKLLFNRETGDKWHMSPLVDITDLVIEVRIWVGRCLEVLLEEDKRLYG